MEIYTSAKLRKDCKFSKLFTYLKRAPASSGRALLRCGVSLGPSGSGGSNSSGSSSVFHWENVMAKFERIFLASYRWYRGKSSMQKSLLLHFSFIIFFQKIFWIFCKGIFDPFYDPEWLPFSWFFNFLKQISRFTIFGRTDMKITLDKSCSP